MRFCVKFSSQSWGTRNFKKKRSLLGTLETLPRVRESGTQERFSCRIQNPGFFCLWNPDFGLWHPEYSSSNLESHQRLQSWIQVPLISNLESSTWNLEFTAGMESRIQDCSGIPYMVQEVYPNDHWVLSKMVDRSSLILRSSPFSKMAAETTFAPQGTVVDVKIATCMCFIKSNFFGMPTSPSLGKRLISELNGMTLCIICSMNLPIFQH